MGSRSGTTQEELLWFRSKRITITLPREAPKNGAFFGSFFKLFAGKTEPTLSFMIISNRLIEVLPAEIRPIGLRDMYLGIRQLPQQKVRQSHFSACAYQKIGV